jgi:type II secretory pathway pseudopilin PulG
MPGEPDNATPKEQGNPTLQMKIAGPEEVRIGGVGSIVAIVVLAVISAVLTILVASARRRAAIERTKAKLAEEKLAKAKDDAKLEQNQAKRDAAARRILELQTVVDNSYERIEELDKAHNDRVKELAKVTSWDDLFED